ncbi:pilus assembly protein TadG-related protein [Brevibacterium luteolum]|uniref:Putative Flp pilus-assembly TadG-like N-terminal domain-containing protein n=1 Tax=Brevibacterium luteolum TaxID=199591 RepID=A0A2N6PER6_9MICO|nr:pilus assembly protein TadG-related protein [Brevibacterium luteolum]MBM7529312.1 putative membrane protein [Brevibacterium luteolum]MBU8579642.1 hypothetical protein [Brevibacterium luteolum]MCT1656694.1 pilus assembly protein TadG-related protein [Brevibacterium luteolum]MCT1829039.1 pilus assembly protein TadG-related protein [Brevibacterium luteolum]MCT1872508.1 pilus assembly protein TadG-related protein [Brevibacterium luteolum]
MIAHAPKPGRLRLTSDDGSITPLAIGFTAIGLALIFLAVVISDIYLAQRKLYALADSAALSAADSFQPSYQGSGPRIEFSDAEVQARAHDYLRQVPRSERFYRVGVRGRAVDDSTVEVSISTRFRPVALSPFVPDGIPLEATATSRGGLRLDR